jgi:hypothetical protein
MAVKRCATCSSTFDEHAWQSLAISHRIEAPEIARLMTSWPVGHCIEVRFCPACGRTIAARAPQ